MRKSILAALLSGCAIGGVSLSADILSNQPGRDYQVGRTLLTRPRIAVTEINRVVGFSKSPITIPSAPGGDFTKTFIVEKSAFPQELYVGANVTIASESTLATGTIIYLNGKVASWNWPSSTLVVSVTKSGNGWGSAPFTSANIGKPNGAGGIYFFRPAGDPQSNGALPGFKGDDTPRSDWSLTFHLPPNFYWEAHGNYLTVSDPATGDYPLISENLACNNWDFSGVPCALVGKSLTNGNPFIVTQSKFEMANRQIADRGQVTFLNMALTNGRFINCDFPWSWRKWGVQVTVTADIASTSATPTIQVSGSLMENPGFLQPLETPNLVKMRSVSGATYRYRVVNLTHPDTMTTCYVSDCVDNTSVTLMGQQSNAAGTAILTPIVSGKTVSAGDQLMIYPEPNQTNFVSGNAGLIDLCNIDNMQDLYNPSNILNQTSDGKGGFLPANNVITRSIINDLGCVNGHDDISQLYNWQGYMEMSYLKINFGFKPGDEAYAAAIRCNNPREMCIWGNNLGWNGETNIHDIMVVTIGGASQYILGSLQRLGGSYMLGVKGVYPSGTNLMRVSFMGPFNGGTVTANQELWTLSGTNTALDGNFKAQNTLTLGGGNGILNASMLSQFGVAAASQGATSLTVTSGSVAAMGKGCVIATAGSAASGPSKTIGVIDSISGSTINLAGSAGIPAALAAGAAVYCYPWLDMSSPTILLPKQGGDVQIASVKAGDVQITVPDTSLYSVGMGVQGYDPSNNGNQQADIYISPFVPDNTFVKSIDSSTKLTLSRPIVTTSTNKWISIAPTLRGNKTGASYFYNLFIGNKDTGLATDFASRAEGYEAFYSAVSGGIAAWNVCNFNRTPLKFYIKDPAHYDPTNGFTGFTGPVYSAAQITAYNQPLAAPANVKVTLLGNGQIRIEFDAVAGAKGYTYTLDGMKFQLDPTNNQAASNGTIISGAVISGLSGVYSVGVASLIGANDIGVPVIRGPVSPLQSVSVAD